MGNVTAKVKESIATSLGIEIDAVQNECTFEDLGADSLDQIEIIMEIENDFDISIPDEKAESFKTVQDVIDYIVEIN